MYPLSIATSFDRKTCPSKKEILNMLDVGQKPFQSIPSPSKVYNRKEMVFPLCDASFRANNYGHRQASITLWVHPFRDIFLFYSLIIVIELRQTNLTSYFKRRPHLIFQNHTYAPVVSQFVVHESYYLISPDVAIISDFSQGRLFFLR